MAEKPGYGELEQRVIELEKEALERKRAEEALRESEEKYRTLFEDPLEAMCLTQLKEAQRLGAGAYVKKPYLLEKISIAVRAELDR